uniref:Kinectin 1 n=1 Tax=Podarcis muralis TaxID=64176 RepID=A0A670HY28_PODMU
MEFYESTYFIVLVPSVVIAVIFLFFWLFMKETLYDEALAKQKRDQKFPPAKADKKKAEKKKSKKKEAQNGNLHESDSESAPRDFKLSDALGAEEEPIPTAPLGVTEAPSGLRERKKKEKKRKGSPEEQAPKDPDSAKSGGKKVEPVPVTKQPTPPSDGAGSKKKAGQKKQKNGIDDQDAKTDSFLSPTKKQDPLLLHHEIKQESVSGKKKVSAKKQKTDNVMTLVDEPLIHATTYIPLMDNADQNLAGEKREAADLVKQDGIGALQKSNSKKLKNETDKENAEVKFKDFLLAMKNMIFTEEEALSVVELLKEKSNVIQDVLQKASKGDSAAALRQLQEKDKLLAAVKEEAATAKEQCKQLSQELVSEKERSSLVAAKLREKIGTLEKDHGVFQNKIHVGYQENQQMKMKFQQVREQMEAEINRLKQENGILRDAVSTSTNQMESKQSSELNKLRQDCARLVNELTEKNSKLQQEELLKKNTEQAVNQLKAQLQEAERRWEEMQSYLRKRTAEHEAAQQDVQNKLVAKDNEIQSLHSKLTDTMVSKQQLEQRMMQLMDAEQKRATAEDSIQRQLQVWLYLTHSISASALAEELHKVIAEKDKQINQAEDSLANERIKLTSKEEDLMALMMAMISFLYCPSSEDHRMVCNKDDKIKTVEELLEAGLIEMANKEDELKVNLLKSRTCHSVALGANTVCLAPPQGSYMPGLISEKDGKIKSVEELLQAEVLKVATKEKTVQVGAGSVVRCLSCVCVCVFVIALPCLWGQMGWGEVGSPAITEPCSAWRGDSQGSMKCVFLTLSVSYGFSITGKEGEIASLQKELGSLKHAVEQQRQKNNDLREKNWKAMEALASTEKLLQDKVNKTAKEKQQYVEVVEAETRSTLQKLFPIVSLPSTLAMEQKLKEAEEMHVMLQQECEKYKVVLAETEGILQRLQRSVEEEESKWKIKIEELQKELQQMRSSVAPLEQAVERLKEEVKELKKEREHLEQELEKAEIERSTYVSEVREVSCLSKCSSYFCFLMHSTHGSGWPKDEMLAPLRGVCSL